MVVVLCRSGRRQASLVAAKGSSVAALAGTSSSSRARSTANQSELTNDTGAMSSGSEDIDAGEGGSGLNRNMSGHNDLAAESVPGNDHSDCLLC